MIALFLIFTLSQAKPLPANALDVIHQGCMKEMSTRKEARAICDCHTKNLKTRMSPQLLDVLAKTYRGISIEKEMNEVEGATVVKTYDESVKAECTKNPKYDVGPDRK